MSLYPDEVLRRFRAPSFATPAQPGDRIGEASTPAAHARLRMHWHVDENGCIQAAGFAALGCPWLVATGDWLAEASIGHRWAELCERMTVEEIASALNIPAVKRYCAVMAKQALTQAGEVNE